MATVAVPPGQGRIPPHDLDAEQAVLGALVLDPQAITKVLDFLKPDDFYRENHAEVYRAAVNLFREGEPIDNLTIAAELEKLGVLDRIGGRAQLEMLQESVPTAANVVYYAQIVKQKAYKRRLISTGTDIAGLGHNEALDADNALNQAQSLLYAIADDRTGSSFHDLYPLLRDAMDRIEAQMQSGRGVVGLPSGFFDLDGMTNGFKQSDLVVVAGRPSMGKCVRGDTPVVDPRTGKLTTVEDAVRQRMPLVHGVDGSGRVRPAAVSAWVDSGIQPCFRVRTRTGREIVVTHHHPFMTPRGWQPLYEIVRGERIAVPRALPCFGEDRSLGLDQVRLLGYLIAAGHLRQGSPGFTSTDIDLIADFREILEVRYPLLRLRLGRRTHLAARAGGRGTTNPLTGWLRQLGLWGRSPQERRIPTVAWGWDRSRLRELVRAIMSCSGTVSSSSRRLRIDLSVAGEGLARDLQHALVRLGVVARISQGGEGWHLEIADPASVAAYQQEVGWFGERTRGYRRLTLPGRPDSGQPPVAVWSLVREVASDRQMTLQRLAVAVAGWPSGEHGEASRVESVNRLAAFSAILRSPLLSRLASPDLYWDEVVAVEAAGEHHVYDLSVPDGANFVAADIVVHNTSLVLNVALNAAIESKVPVAIFSLEMSKEQLVERMLCEQARIDAQRMHRGILSETEQQRLVMALGPLGDAPIWIDDSPTLDELGLMLKARQIKLRHEIGMIVVDYLQLMRGHSRGDDYNRVQEVSSISRSLKGLARELKVPVLAVSQLSRAPEQRPDRRPLLSDLRESGCLAAETPVLLDSGEYVPISELDGKSGVRVLALDQETWKLVPAPVTAAFSTGRKPVFRLTTGLGRSLRATANHKFLTIEGWKRLDELVIGQRIALPRLLSLEGQVSMTFDELALLGHLIGDGCTLPGHAIQYTTAEADLANLVADLAQRFFGAEVMPRVRAERGWYQVYLSSARRLARGRRNPIAQWLTQLGVFGLRSHQKFVPSVVFSQPPTGIAHFLRHLWSTDGCIHLPKTAGCARIYYATSSERLARDVMSLLLRLGLNSVLSRHEQGSKGRPQFHVDVSGRSEVETFLSMVGPLGAKKTGHAARITQHVADSRANTNRDVLPREVWATMVVPAMHVAGLTTRQVQAAIGMAYCGSALYKNNLSRERAGRVAEAVFSRELATLAESDVYWDKVASIDLDGEEDVYDLTVDGFHNFIAGDVVVHNSIEQDADLVMFIFRPEYYKSDDKPGIAEVIVAKHRNGPTGTVELKFRKELTRFENLERRRPEPTPDD